MWQDLKWRLAPSLHVVANYKVGKQFSPPVMAVITIHPINYIPGQTYLVKQELQSILSLLFGQLELRKLQFFLVKSILYVYEMCVYTELYPESDPISCVSESPS